MIISLVSHVKNITLSSVFARYGILSLLLVNLAFFLSNQMVLRSSDTIAWLIILVFIEWPEAEMLNMLKSHWHLKIQFLALGIIGISCYNSFIHSDWVSLANEITWLCVLLLPEVLYTKYKWFKPILYFSLSSFAIILGLNGGWIECYDALLWIAAFLELEYEQNNSWLTQSTTLL